MAEKLKVELSDDNGNVYYLHTDASVVFCEDGTPVETKLNQMLSKSDIVQNATTAATNKVPSAAVAKNLQDQITQQNTKFEDVTDKFNWGTATNYMAYKIGKTVFFSAMCNEKSTEPMNFASIKDAALQPIAFTPLVAYTGLGADFTDRVTAYVRDNLVTVRSYDGYDSAVPKALQGGIVVNGSWLIH